MLGPLTHFVHPAPLSMPEAGDEDGQSGEGNTRLRRYEELTRPPAPRRDAQKRLASPSTATPSCFPRPALPERKPAGRRDGPESAVFTSSERTLSSTAPWDLCAGPKETYGSRNPFSPATDGPPNNGRADPPSNDRVECKERNLMGFINAFQQ